MSEKQLFLNGITKKRLAIFLGVILLVSSGFIVGRVMSTDIVVAAPPTIIQVLADNSSHAEAKREAELMIVKLDLQEYPHLSETTRDRILASLDSASIKYRIPVGFLHAIFRIESNYQFQIDHPKITIRVKGKVTKTCARGLGGIVWEIWADSLKKKNICSAYSDLYLPENNIEASAYILRYETDRVILSHKNDQPYNLIREIIKNYYGAYSEKYEARMLQITNELWLKRIARDLISL